MKLALAAAALLAAGCATSGFAADRPDNAPQASQDMNQLPPDVAPPADMDRDDDVDSDRDFAQQGFEMPDDDDSYDDDMEQDDRDVFDHDDLDDDDDSPD